MVLAQPSGSESSSTRSFEEIVADIQTLTRELIDTAGPAALDGTGLGGASGLGSRLTAVSPMLRTVCSQLDVVRMTWLYRIEADGMWALDGSRTFRAWLARREKVTLRTAGREVLTAERLLEHLPATLAAALGGRLGMDQVRSMVDVGPTSDERRRALVTPVDATPDGPVASTADTTDGDGSTPGDGPAPGDGPVPSDGGGSCEDAVDRPTDGTAPGPTGEELLLDLADQHGPLVFRRFVDRFARVADPASDERGYKRAAEREHLDVAKTFGGYHVDGFLTDEHGEALRAAMDSVMGAPTPGDDRSPTQRRAQALADLARAVLDSGSTGSGAAVRPHVTVTVSWTELTRLTDRSGAPPNHRRGGRGSNGQDVRDGTCGTGIRCDSGGDRDGDYEHEHEHRDGLFDPPTTLTDVTAAPARFGISASLVPTAALRRLLCDSAVTRVVFGPDGQVLDVGRSQRTVTGQMRRAVIARDKHCVYPDCTQPPTRCEVHHAERHWADGGETSVRNSALLCYHHHDLVDTTGITMRWTGNPEGSRHSGWTMIDRHGHEIGPVGALPDHATRRAA
ncbi:HNH endonuclease signature motif containing protein [Promicromonospora iranensis]|uniref:Plasmid stabilization system protein ParE n=1 Tax=Promicromonospora iranensis TaxID=1105144 RepID=A0ABU2CTX7_9MICO|nr:HNH endonuclease signature motif containing protein [Promicromonospora iranensis]MDR7384804.1 plasmid stabilization system protein ParE [Promicromonospora iranensis]